MDAARFERWTRASATLFSRRATASALGLAALALLNLADARKKHKHKKKKIKRNDFGCVNVGGFCKHSGQCCSGICKGKKGKKRCKAHDVSTCQGEDVCILGVAACTTSTGEPGDCTRTTGNASYCQTDGKCFPCKKDVDCVPFCGAGAACIVCPATCGGPGGTYCAGLSGGICTFPP